MSNLDSQRHAISNIMSPPPGGLSSSQQDRDQVMPAATSMSDDTSAPYPDQPPSYISSKNAAGIGSALRDSSATSTSNSSPAAVVDAQSRDGVHRRGVKVNNKRGPSKAGGKPGEAGTSNSAGTTTNKRRCVSNACIACRKRKSKVCAIHRLDPRIFITFSLVQVAYGRHILASMIKTTDTSVHKHSWGLPLIYAAMIISLIDSAMAILHPAPHVPRYMGQNVSTTQAQTIAGKGYTKRILTISKPAMILCKPSYKQFWTTLRNKYMS